MLRIERIFESGGIQEGLDIYNPLILGGTNWKSTFMIEYEDPAAGKQALSEIIGIERSVQIKVDGFDPVTPIANEDLPRETEEKTSYDFFNYFYGVGHYLIPLSTSRSESSCHRLSTQTDSQA